MHDEKQRDDLIARNLAVVEAHFHNENPDDVEKAVALYTDDIVWEAPSRGQVYQSAVEVKAAYLDIFQTLCITSLTLLRQVATETTVFTDHIAEATVVGDRMPHLPFGIGTKINARLVHLFELRDGKICREIAYEMWREAGSAIDHDDIPANAIALSF